MIKEAYQKNLQDLFSELNSSEKGLSSEIAEDRLAKYGKNEIKRTNVLKPFKIFFDQFQSFLIYILIIAAIISFLISHIIDGVVISIIVILNAIIGFTQQYHAERSIENLKKLLIPKSRVLRNNSITEISSQDLVPGDIVLFTSGDRVTADCRILESENLQTNEAVLTGESLPVDKDSKIISKKKELAEQKNLLFTGTQIVRGDCRALVLTTGMNTQFGKIAETLQGLEQQKTPMQKKLDRFSKQIGIIILVLVGIILFLGLTEHFNFIEMFLTAVALAVSAIPEGLPAVLTLAFAISSILMSKQKVVVRRLPAVESLGSVTVICSDKTGTMTEEKMSIQKIFANDYFFDKKDKDLFINNKKVNVEKNKELFLLLKTSILCNNARFEIVKDKYEIIGDPTEQALVANSLDLGLNKKTMIEAEPSLKKFEFDSIRKMMSVLRDNKRNRILYSKGAPEKILSISSFELVAGQIKKLTEKRKKELLEKSHSMEKEALRVLGFAYKNFALKEKPEEKGLIFLGFAGMIDPPRKEVKEAISQCKSAGISIKMITGDSALTAKAIANQIGILGKTITESELEKMTDEELLKQIEEIAIFARTSPQQKLRITQLLQKKGEVVAITGDGINDSLALKSADIGVAMGIRGTDVSRDVSDIVLIDDNFASLVEGVREGRKTYDNIKKFTKYLLAVNFSELVLISFALILNFPLPLLPLQILWINLITDSLPALSLAFEKEEDVMKTKPRKEKTLLAGIWKFVLIGGLLTFIAKTSVFLLSINQEFNIDRVRTIVWTTAILFELFFVYTCRHKKPLLKDGIFSNKWLNYSVLFSIILHLILIYSPLAKIFGAVALNSIDWLFILPFAFSGLIVFEIGKYIKFTQQKEE